MDYKETWTIGHRLGVGQLERGLGKDGGGYRWHIFSRYSDDDTPVLATDEEMRELAELILAQVGKEA